MAKAQGLVLAEHHGWQLVAGAQAVATVAAALGLHRHTQFLQVGDVAAHAAPVHLTGQC